MRMYGDLISVFGAIFLIMTVIGGMRMKKVADPNCPEDVYDVEMNHKWYKIFMWLWGSVTAIGLVLLFIETCAI